jgi:transcriptional regulator with XRE-family HTH domain
MMDRFGEKLAVLRKKRGLTLRALGKMLEVDHTYISQLEKRKTKPNTVMILKLADIFGVTADQLMRDELELDG